MSFLTVDIVTAERPCAEGVSATSVTAPGTFGTFQVLPGHATLLALLEIGPVVLETPGGSRWFAVAGGFAEVVADHVRILADQAVAAEEIDGGMVSGELQAVTAKLGEADPFSDEAKNLRQRERFLTLQQRLSGSPPSGATRRD